MTDIMDSFSEWFKEKHNSSVYGIYIIAFIAWNWRMFYVLFLEDNIVGDVTTLSYAEKFSHHLEKFNTGYFLLDNEVVSFVLNHIILFGVPLIVTYFAIWWLPYMNNLAHERQLKFYFERRSLFDSENTKYQRLKNSKLKEFNEVTKEQTKILKDIVTESEKKLEIEENVAGNIYAREASWDMEYKKLNEYFKQKVLKNISEMVYKYGGKLVDSWNNSTIQTDELAYADTNGLLELKKNTSDIYQLTEKGKYFLKKILEK
ncbi:TPA: hypothetical protein DEP58_01455 [Patescibacteria group bacterium]|nr:MAG: hypothetical protein UU98_C0010G0020 [Parcubacteria group bacterium GW2011_GWD2_42_14]HCC04956.1 hypothetical protein [Patescibacteria group bacterium]